jgi:hypothetical protein
MCITVFEEAKRVSAALALFGMWLPSAMDDDHTQMARACAHFCKPVNHFSKV